MSQRLDPKERQEQILSAALDLAERKGWQTLTRDGIADHAGVSPGLVSLHMGTMNKLRRTVMRAAVQRERLPIVAEGLAVRDAQALKASPELQRKALATLTRG
jgi:AcrR family transcriptional regulator